VGVKPKLEVGCLDRVGESEVSAIKAVTVPDRFRCEVIVAMPPAPLNPLAESALEACGPKVLAAKAPALDDVRCGCAAGGTNKTAHDAERSEDAWGIRCHPTI